MRKASHIAEGCSLAMVAMVALAIFGGFVVFRSMITGLPWFQSEADRAQAHIQALETQQQFNLSQPWQPWTVGAKEFLFIAICVAIAMLALGGAVGFLASQRRKAQLVWPRDGQYGIPFRALVRDEDLPHVSIQMANRFHDTELANATRMLPPVHQHITGKATKEVEPDLPDEDHHEVEAFHDAYAAGQYKGA